MATQKRSIKKSSPRRAKSSSPMKTSGNTQDMQSTAALAETSGMSSANSARQEDWRKRFFVPIIIVLLAVLAYVGMQQLVVATVNGVPISRITLLKEMESQIGDQVLDSLITRQLIVQEAKKQNITVTDEEIDEEINKLKEQFTASGQDFDQLLELQGMTMERVREEIRLQKIIEKAVAGDTEVTDEEVDAFIEQNSAFLPEGQAANDPKLREDVTQQLKQQKIGEKTNVWIEELKQNASIKYFGPFAQKVTPTATPAIEVPEGEPLEESTESPDISIEPAE
ncbi:MAG: SurA N-terminal domain-containing protein [Candidatus Roizmanbacteria bacterium]|nr:SurA N-terminal domain-containing protein [Candidatus Roizmanbacteria bacterium]